MQEAASRQTAPVPPTTGTVRRSDCWPLAVLLLIAILMHAWLIGHTEVAARDSIGFIRYAVQLQEKPWTEVLRNSEQHPIYPLTVLAASIPVRHYVSGELPDQMVLSAQLASSLAAVLLVIPMFYLGCELFDRRVGFWAAALFQCLPVSAQVTADALSEALFLLFATTAILLATRALRRGSVALYGWSGLVGGLAYLTRPEGALIVGTIGLVLLGTQFARAWRRPWRRVLLQASCLAGPALIMILSFVLITGRLTTKPTGNHLLHNLVEFIQHVIASLSWSGPGQLLSAAPSGATRPLLGMVWGAWWMGDGPPTVRWGLWALAEEVTKSGHYWAAPLALLGFVWFRARLRTTPGMWILLLVALFHSLVLWRMAVVMGYISERHTLLLVMCGLYWAAAAAMRIVDGLAGLLCRWGLAADRGRWLSVSAATLMLLLLSFGLPPTLKPLHYNRAGHRAAGIWLRANAHPGDVIIDPFCWAHYYAGWVFREGNDQPPGYGNRIFAVIEDSHNPHGRLTLLELAKFWAKQGQLAFATPLKSRQANDEQLQIWVVEIKPPPPPPPRRKKAHPPASSAAATD